MAALQDKTAFMATGKSEALHFPTDLTTNPTYAGNYMMFTAMKVSGGVDTRTLKFALAEGRPSSVALPIPTGVNAQYQNNWDQTDVAGPIAAMASKSTGVMQAIQKISGRGSLTSMASEAVDQVAKLGSDAVGGLKVLAADLPGAAQAANTAGAGVVNEMMGFGATTPGVSAIIQGAQYDLGIRALNQTMMSYGGPGFRSFSWSYSLKPLTPGEAETAQGIVDFFKVRSMPAQSELQFTRIYNLPDVFRIQFYNADGESEYISKIGHCACTDVNVTYGGEKFTTFAGSHSPIQIDITLSFKELELLNRQAVANERNTGVWPEETYTKDAKKIPDAPEITPTTESIGRGARVGVE